MAWQGKVTSLLITSETQQKIDAKVIACRGIFFLCIVNVYSSHWLVEKLLWPIGRQDKAR